jgi:UDP-N-acetylmuramate dehydrogenase
VIQESQPKCCSLTEMKIEEDVPLGPFTTFGIGGPARFLIEATTETEIIDGISFARERALPLFVLGGGSNLLVSDVGFAGVVLRVALKGIESVEDKGTRVFSAAAGENWDRFVCRAVAEDCAGIECLAGIPGTVGGTPVQNVGAYGQEVAETIEDVRVLDLESLAFREMSASECGFSYRTSLFNSSARGRFLVSRVDYRLNLGAPANLRYAELKKAFPADSQPGLAEVAATVRKIRQAKGMLLVEGDPDCRSAGSFFKNPIVSNEMLPELTAKFGTLPPNYPAGEDKVKLAAAWLIERAGFPKGFRLGRAGISSRHTLALVNLGGAQAADILALRDLIANRLVSFGITLEMEPVLLGF